MTVAVRLFSVLRERAGRELVQIELPDGATVADALEALAQLDGLRGVLPSLPVQMAVNREYASRATALREQDELALIPPLSGGAGSGGDSGGAGSSGGGFASVTEQPLDPAALAEAVRDPRAGAIVTFLGVTREVPRLDYEAYSEMAQERIARIVEECAARHSLCAAAAQHRVGEVGLGEPSVIVAVSAPHRDEAFAAAREIIDRIKSEAPIWKREVGEDGIAHAVPGVPAPGAPPPLTHIDESGRARMVDVGSKEVSQRLARARARVRMSEATARAVERGDAPKGDVLGTARLAGIQAAKRTDELIPLAHQVALSFVDVTASVDAAAGVVEILAEARARDRTGVEMEALTACAAAALTVYDMLKGIERGVRIEQVVLLEKRGGRHDWTLGTDGSGAGGKAP